MSDPEQPPSPTMSEIIFGPATSGEQAEAPSPTMTEILFSGQSTAGPPATAVRRSGLGLARTELRHLKGQASLCHAGSQVEQAWKQAFMAKYYSTVGRVYWKYLAGEARQHQWHWFQFYTTVQYGGVEIAQTMQNTLRALVNPNSEVNEDVYDEDDDATELNDQSSETFARFHRVNTDLHWLFINCVSITTTKERDDLLAAIHDLLPCKIGLDAKMILLSKAMVCYPMETFQSDSAVLQSFINMNDQMLQQEAASEGAAARMALTEQQI